MRGEWTMLDYGRVSIDFQFIHSLKLEKIGKIYNKFIDFEIKKMEIINEYNKLNFFHNQCNQFQKSTAVNSVFHSYFQIYITKKS